MNTKQFWKIRDTYDNAVYDCLDENDYTVLNAVNSIACGDKHTFAVIPIDGNKLLNALRNKFDSQTIHNILEDIIELGIIQRVATNFYLVANRHRTLLKEKLQKKYERVSENV